MHLRCLDTKLHAFDLRHCVRGKELHVGGTGELVGTVMVGVVGVLVTLATHWRFFHSHKFDRLHIGFLLLLQSHGAVGGGVVGARVGLGVGAGLSLQRLS